MTESARSTSLGAVDVHAHAVPATLVGWLDVHGANHGVEPYRESDGSHGLQLGGRRTAQLSTDVVDLSKRLTAMDDMGVGLQVMSPWMELVPQRMDHRDAAWYVSAFNDHLQADVQEAPERLAGFGMVDVTGPYAARELSRCVDDLGLIGVEVPVAIPGLSLADPMLDKFWRAAEDRSALLLLHPIGPLSGEHLAKHRLGDILGSPFAGSAAVAELILGGVLRRHPGLRLCLVHGGGTLPYLAGRMDAIAKLDEYPWPPGWASGDLARLYFDSLTHSSRTLAWLVEFAGADHVMVGSDYPFSTGCSDPVASVRDVLGTHDGDAIAVLSGTANELLATCHRRRTSFTQCPEQQHDCS